MEVKESDAFKSKALKELYPDVELRKKFAAQKLEKSKGHNQVLVRCEPHPKHCRIAEAPFITLMAPTNYEVAYILATIQTRVISQKSLPQSSAYLFWENKLVTAFREQLGTFWAKHREEDNILYFTYADTAPF